MQPDDSKQLYLDYQQTLLKLLEENQKEHKEILELQKLLERLQDREQMRVDGMEPRKIEVQSNDCAEVSPDIPKLENQFLMKETKLEKTGQSELANQFLMKEAKQRKEVQEQDSKQEDMDTMNLRKTKAPKLLPYIFEEGELSHESWMKKMKQRMMQLEEEQEKMLQEEGSTEEYMDDGCRVC